MMIIVDYGAGNPGAIKNMLKKLGVTAAISSDKSEIERADKLILPGVGAFDNAMRNLDEKCLTPLLKQKSQIDKIPILGICLGMQIFADESMEGTLGGLGLVSGSVKRFDFAADNKLKVPHMGWNSVCPKKRDTLFKNMPDEIRFYFVHSYHFVCLDDAAVLATSDYGYEFVSAVEKGNIFGVQFHPEKSHKFGLALLKNFAEL